jgi:hypothetical protein
VHKSILEPSDEHFDTRDTTPFEAEKLHQRPPERLRGAIPKAADDQVVIP